MTAPATEAPIQKSIVEAARRMGLLAIRINSGIIKKGRNAIHLAPAGTPDLLFPLHDGRSLWVETKAPAGKLRPDQVVMHDELRGRGHVVLVARSCEDFLAWFEGQAGANSES